MIPADLFVNAVVLLIHSPFLIQFSSSTSKSPTPENSISHLFLLNAHKRDKKRTIRLLVPNHMTTIYISGSCRLQREVTSRTIQAWLAVSPRPTSRVSQRNWCRFTLGGGHEVPDPLTGKTVTRRPRLYRTVLYTELIFQLISNRRLHPFSYPL